MPLHHLQENIACDACEALQGRDPEGLWVEVEAGALVATYVTDRQRAPGSLLVLPRRHARWLGELSAAECHALGSAILRAARALDYCYRPHGWHLWTGSGAIAGQSMSHMHFQLVPRHLAADYSFAPSAELRVTGLEERRAQATSLQRHLFGPSAEHQRSPRSLSFSREC